jgi:hypothetical protein
MDEFKGTAKGVIALALLVGFGMIMLGQFGKTATRLDVNATGHALGMGKAINNTLSTMYGSTGLGSYATWIGLIILLGIFVYFMAKFDKI